MNTDARTEVRRKIVVGAVAFFVLVLALTTVFGKKGLLEIYRTRKEYASLLREIQSLKDEKGRLEKEIAALRQDPQAVEREARDKLWLIRPDEKVIIHK